MPLVNSDNKGKQTAVFSGHHIHYYPIHLLLAELYSYRKSSPNEQGVVQIFRSASRRTLMLWWFTEKLGPPTH